MEFEQMMYVICSYHAIYLDVRELAFRFREATENIVSALLALERDGSASRTADHGV
jgi:hypothetical protein